MRKPATSSRKTGSWAAPTVRMLGEWALNPSPESRAPCDLLPHVVLNPMVRQTAPYSLGVAGCADISELLNRQPSQSIFAISLAASRNAPAPYSIESSALTDRGS